MYIQAGFRALYKSTQASVWPNVCMSGSRRSARTGLAATSVKMMRDGSMPRAAASVWMWRSPYGGKRSSHSTLRQAQVQHTATIQHASTPSRGHPEHETRTARAPASAHAGDANRLPSAGETSS